MSIARSLAAAAAVILFVILPGGAAGTRLEATLQANLQANTAGTEWPGPAISVIASAQGQPSWHEASHYVALFAPAARAAAYHAYVSPLALDAVLRTLTGDPSLLRPPGAWQPALLSALDAFGRSGAYDRGKLARLYRGRAAAVARGPRAADGRVVESWLLVSPYPDPSLERLEAGTLLLVLTVGGPEGPPLPTGPGLLRGLRPPGGAPRLPTLP